MATKVLRGAFANPNNIVTSTVSGSWTPLGTDPWDGDIDIQGVYTDLSATKDLKIRDLYGNVIYHFVSDGESVIDMFPTVMTVKGPLEYYTDEAGKKVIICGKVE